jgi:hypothetical protein
VKLLLALLALLTGFSVSDGVRISEPSIAQDDGTVLAAWVATEEAKISAHAAVYLVATFSAVCLAIAPIARWAALPAPRRVAATVYRSDRLRQ